MSIVEPGVAGDLTAAAAAGGVRFRAMVPADLGQVARLHRQHFPDGYYVRLGDRFLAAFYRGYLDSPHTVALVAESDAVVQAFLVGTTDQVTHRRRVVRTRWLAVMTAGVVALAARPALWADFVRVRSHWYARRALAAVRRRTPAGAGQVPFGELDYVITSTTARQRGIGAALVDYYLRATRDAGASHACLVTLADNHVARRFYEKRGWATNGERRTRDGIALAAFRLDLCQGEQQ